MPNWYPKLRFLILVTLVLWAPRVFAGEPVRLELVQRLLADPSELLPTTIDQIASTDHESALQVLRAFTQGRLGLDDDGAPWIVENGAKRRAIEQTSGIPRGQLRLAMPDNQTRRLLNVALMRLQLRSTNVIERRNAATEIASHPDATSVALLRTLRSSEPDRYTQRKMAIAIAKLDIESADRNLRIAAAKTIEQSNDISMREPLEAMLKSASTPGAGELDPEVRRAISAAVASIAWQELKIRTFANLLYGLSLGSVLLLAALGLAITFGLMKVINMAHGEMLMLGAYATFATQVAFQRFAPAWQGLYLILSVPVAFATTAGVGLLLERFVVRRLYGRPLETLLATWGLSLILIQSIRSTFGAQNVTVATPEWLSGGWELMPTVVVPYSRVLVLGFTCLVVTFVWLVLQRTSLGLKLRAVTQNRDMAAALGIPTRRIDAWTFALGSGVAGLGGVALSQLGNVGPELGQQHIIDSFMVVVLGGVGNILGSVVGAFGLGILAKFLEPTAGAVLGKICILVLIILFIQWRPQGLFALKGRAVEG